MSDKTKRQITFRTLKKYCKRKKNVYQFGVVETGCDKDPSSIFMLECNSKKCSVWKRLRPEAKGGPQ